MTRVAQFGYRTLLLLMLVGIAANAAAAKPSIAILGIEVIDRQGIASSKDTQVAQELTAALRARAKSGGPYVLASGGDKELIDQKLIKNCDDERTPCMAAIGADLGADFLLYGRIERSSGTYNVSVVLLDVRRKAREKTYSDAIPTSEANGTTLQSRAKHIYSVLTGQAETCTISVKPPGGPERAMIFLNDDNQGSGTITNNAGEVPNLAAGRYKVTVVAPDFHRWEKPDVTCPAGQTTVVTADMHHLSTTEDHSALPTIDARAAKSEPKSSSWRRVAIGSGIATGVFAAGFGVSWGLLASTGASKKPGAGPFEYGGKCVTDAGGNSTGPGLCSSGSTLRVLTFVSGIAAAAGFGFTVFALIKAVSEPEHRETATASTNRAQKPALAVAPVIGVDNVGASVQLSW